MNLHSEKDVSEMRCGIVIFSGYNDRAVIAFLRTLQTNNLDDYVIIARDPDDQIFMTDHISHLFDTRTDSDLNMSLFRKYADRIRQEKHWDSFLIAPSTEGLNRFLLKEREALEELGYIIPLVGRDLYIGISDKKSFSEFCSRHELLIPMETGYPKEFRERFVAKPLKYRYSGDGKVYTPVLVRNAVEFEHFRKTYPSEAFYYQEYLEGGDSIYLLYYFSKDGSVFNLTQRNLAQLDNGGSMVLSGLCKEKLPIVEVFSTLMSELGFTGFIMIEIRIIEDRCYVIEANPRFWGPAQLFVDAGYNLFEAFLSDWGFINKYPDRTVDSDAFYYWSGGIIREKARGGKVEVYTDDRAIVDDPPENIRKYDLYKRDDTIRIWRSESA